MTAPVRFERLQVFVSKIRPGGWGRRRIRPPSAVSSDKPGMNLLRWLFAVVLLFTVNFSLGWLLLR